jgi:glycerol-3-phosphate dehydrogenase
MLTRSEILQRIPALDPSGVTGAGVFYDGQIADPTGLVFAIVRSAQDAGAVALNYCAAERLLTRNGRVEGLSVTDQESGRRFDMRAPLVADVTGPFARRLSAILGSRDVRVPLSRDMAFVVRRRVLPGMALALQTRFRDPDAWFSRGNRHLFLCPWRDRYTLIGVNSRVYNADPYDLSVDEGEIQLFLDEIRDAWPALELRRDEVTVVNAGLLPFGDNEPSSKDLSFGKRSPVIDHGVVGGPQGLFTGMAVRWTMGRLLGERLTDMFLQRLGRPTERCRTSETPVRDTGRRPRLGVNAGNEDEAPGDLGLAVGSVRDIVRQEMVLTLRDLVLRRLDVGTGECPDGATLETLSRIAGDELGWSDAKRSAEVLLVERSYPFASPASQALLSDAP